MEKVGLVLSLYSWAALALIVVLVFFIARFYQQKSGYASHYRLFLAPAALFVLSGVLCVFGGEGGGLISDLSNALLLIGGGLLIVLSRSLYVIMMGGRK